MHVPQLLEEWEELAIFIQTYFHQFVKPDKCKRYRSELSLEHSDIFFFLLEMFTS